MKPNVFSSVLKVEVNDYRIFSGPEELVKKIKELNIAKN